MHVKKDSCGRPLSGVEIKIVTEDGAPVATGVAGEILVLTSQGYLGDEDLIQAAVVDGWLKTGDIGHLDYDGFLYIDGRLRDPSLKPSDLRDHCHKRLSPIKVPYQYTIVKSLPRTSTGKIQKNMLE